MQIVVNMTKQKYHFIINYLTLVCTLFAWSQDISFYDQWNGHVNFTMIGNTLNTGENNPQQTLQILDNSAAVLNLPEGSTVLSAYLYWSGSGTGDFNVVLNNTNITAERTFSEVLFNSNNLFDFFGCFANITNLVQTLGNTTYQFSGLDNSAFLPSHFSIRTNYAGWAIIIIYEDLNLPINQINLYDGLEGIPSIININLTNLNVVNTENAKIGFLSFEGDSSLTFNETVRFNNNILSNLPINPANNVFNSTNTYTNSNQLYNMDLDEFSISEFINVGDTAANVQITSGQDFVLVNAVLVQLNNSLPDATIEINQVIINCDDLEMTIDFTVFNNLSTWPLPANVPIAFYINNQLIGSSQTQNSIPIDGFELGMLTLNLPANLSLPFTLVAVVDDLGDGTGTVLEINENNNTFNEIVNEANFVKIENINALKGCDKGFGLAEFDLTKIKVDLNKPNLLFFESFSDAINQSNPIVNLTSYQSTTPNTVFAITDDLICKTIYVIPLESGKCKPVVYNYVSANQDGLNDTFFIEGLRDVFLQHKIYLYDRWGSLIWTGDQNSEPWQGFNNTGFLAVGNHTPKQSTYFYVIELNDLEFPEPLVGFLYYVR